MHSIHKKWEGGGTSQALHAPMMTIADSLRLCAPPFTKIAGRRPHDTNCGTSEALAPPSRKGRDVSGSVHPHMKMADRLRLRALCVHSAHENCGTSQAFCTPMMNLPTVSGSEHFLSIPLTKIVSRLRLFSTPMMKLPTVSGSEHFLRTPRTKIVGRLRLFSTPP